VRRPVTLFALIALLAAFSAFGSGAAAAPSDTNSDRDAVRAAKAQVAANINVLKANQQDLENALDLLKANVDAEEGHLQEAQRAVDEADAQIHQAQQGIDASTAKLKSLRGAIAAYAVQAYIGPDSSALSTLLSSSNATAALQREELRGDKTGRDADLVDSIRGITAQLQAQRRAATDARTRAAKKRAEVQVRVNKVEAAKKAQQRLVDKVQSRIDGQVSRSIELAKQDRKLSAQLAFQQAALQARVAAARLSAAQAQASINGSTAAYGNGGSENRPVAGPGGVSSAGSSGSVSLCTVGGITVNCQISSPLRAMLSAAAADGVSLSGGGYRDPAQQIALRQEHCGSSQYAIYQMPSGQCSPPTARPGQSMHELGLAIDFDNCSRGSAAFNWLRGHAGSFGFYNLPSESWHWSVNGN